MDKQKLDLKFILPFLAALAVFLFGAIKLGMNLWEYYQGSRQYQMLEHSMVFPETKGPGTKEPEEKVDFDGLSDLNPDTAAWIIIEGLGISYPVVQGKDNEYYLTHTFYGEENKCGSIFMEAGNEKDFSDQNTFVYGHNMKDKSMFARLNEFQQRDTYLENPEFYIYTQGEVKRYQIFSCYIADLAWDSFRFEFQGKKDYAKWQKAVRQRSLYDTGVAPKPGQKTVTLMTCTPAGEKYRFLVHGALCPSSEKNK